MGQPYDKHIAERVQHGPKRAQQVSHARSDNTLCASWPLFANITVMSRARLAPAAR